MHDVFISFSSKDIRLAEIIREKIETSGPRCWISSRDVAPGDNYQAAIVEAIRRARVMVLVFSSNANASHEISKELALASQNELTVIPARVEDVVPSDAFRFELATRQYIDLFRDWDAALDRLVKRVGDVIPSDGIDPRPSSRDRPRKRGRWTAAIIGAVGIGVAIAASVGWPALRERFAASAPSASVVPQPATVAPPLAAIAASPAVVAPPPTAPAVAPTADLVVPPPVRRIDSDPTPVEIMAAPSASEPGVVGRAFKECANCPEMVVIPAGLTMIGSPDGESGHEASEAPRTFVRIDRPLAVGRDAVTFAEWDACVADGACGNHLPGDMGWGRGSRPVIFVSWHDGQAYTGWLSRKTGAVYRLLSETEWEHAARACRDAECRDLPFGFGQTIRPDQANYDTRQSYGGGNKAQAMRRTVPTRAFRPNGFGLFDIVGNVATWVADCWNPTLAGLPPNGSPRTTGDCSGRVLRGGSWNDPPIALRSAARAWDVATTRQPHIGLRVARDLTP
ncbi:SUMF1/EgtB/PvdO family nonheme iron enzyme [Siculibacillus lacustris]|nr:SUMF1/EgtB/PvdO family nonheme iron enzyme [Siculibacillus lacustris]